MAATLSPPEREALVQQFDKLIADGPLSLLTRKLFAELASVECAQEPVLSLYVDLSPQNRHNHAWAIDLKSNVRDVLAGIEGRDDQESVRAEFERMERWLKDHVQDMGRGVAIFSCPPKNLWWQVSLPVNLPTRARVGRRPYLRPLARVRDEHDRFAVVSLDKQRARLFVSQLGHVQEVADIFEDTPGHHKQGGWSQMRFQRHHEAHVMWHAGAVAQATEILMDRFETRHLLASGTPEVLAEYRAHLPGHVAKRWAGEFGLAVDAAPAEVGRTILPLQEETESREEMDAITRVNDSVSSERGVWGLESTLSAVHQRRIRLLVVHDRYRVAGQECLRCHLLLSENGSACPACQGPLEPVEDVVDALLEQAVGQEAELELVRSNRARMLLPPGQPIGAVLRY